MKGADSESYFILDPMSSRIWKSLAEPIALEAFWRTL